jgi:hypothetical protein
MTAQMFPPKPRAGTDSQAEVFLFRELEKQLPDSYYVYHSVAWQIRDKRGGSKDGEADFVIINPQIGILVLEVKGGRISYDRKNDQWMSNGELLDDPFRQAKFEKYNLLNKLKESFGSSYYFNIGHAVAFPDVRVVDGFGIDSPRDIIIDATDVPYLREWVESFFSSLRPEKRAIQPLDSYALRKIGEIFNPSWRFSEFITSYFARLNMVIEQLTEEQYVILDYLKRHRRVAISGCAGSGKTLVALEKAIRLQHDGFSVLFLCHNPYLANSLRLRVEGLGIHIYDFRRYIDFVNVQDRPPEYPDLMPDLPWTQYDEPPIGDLELAYARLLSDQSMKYDAVIIDEGQDFRESWWRIAETSLHDSDNGILYIFYDDRQILSSVEPMKPFVSQAPHDLSKNCRNAGEIYKLVQELGEAMPPPHEELTGMGVVHEWLYTSHHDLYQKLKEALIDAETYSDQLKEIVVVTTEQIPLEKSILNGMKFRTSALQRSSEKTAVPWQEAVLRYLIPRGANRNLLSNEMLPTEHDKNSVKDFSLRWLDRNRASSYSNGKRHIKRVPFKWSMDNYGRLALYDHGQTVPESDIWEILIFFSTRDWSNSLPQPHKLYRLSRVEDADKYRDYQNVRLTNIPSFKGLEANGVVFVCHDHTGGFDSSIRASLYVGLSRARHLLNIVTSKPIRDEISRLNKFAYH